MKWPQGLRSGWDILASAAWIVNGGPSALFKLTLRDTEGEGLGWPGGWTAILKGFSYYLGDLLVNTGLDDPISNRVVVAAGALLKEGP